MNLTQNTNLESLRDNLLAPIEIIRDEDGHFYHPALPLTDENVSPRKLLEAFGLKAKFVSIEDDCADKALLESVSDGGSCAAWEPSPPAGDGWVLLAIYDTEDGVIACFARPEPMDTAHRATDDGWPKLEKPASLLEHGGATFGKGVSSRLLVEACYRHHERTQEARARTPEQRHKDEMQRRAAWDLFNGGAAAVLADAGAAPAGEWQTAECIADVPEVHEALQNFSEDQTGDNGICVIRAVMRARARMVLLTVTTQSAASPSTWARTGIKPSAPC